MNGPKDLFLLTFGYGELSMLELVSLEESGIFPFEIIALNESAALIDCKNEFSGAVVKRLGGSYKMGRLLGNDIEHALERIKLPDDPKFNWTVSVYGVDEETASESKEALHNLLKKSGLGKAKFLEPSPIELHSGKRVDKHSQTVTKELMVSDLLRRIIGSSETPGIDLIVHAGMNESSPMFAQTINLSDVVGYEERDSGRPFQDPTLTIGPRFARMMINLATFSKREQRILDPFCGLGTILQEALCCGHSVIGVDKRGNLIRKSAVNLDWCKTKYRLQPNQEISTLRYDSSRLNENLIRHVDSIATDPILLPRFESNPKSPEIEASMKHAKETYNSAFNTIVHLLKGRNSRVVVSTPVIIGADGRPHTFSLDLASFRENLVPYRPKKMSNVDYPLEVTTMKKKIVKRAISVFTLDL